MIWKVVSAVLLTVAAGAGAVYAQSANDFRGPRELPPASFTGQQFVDSRGCVFLRAGIAGRVNWVPRITASRKQLCGYPSTFAKQTIDVVEDAPKAVPAPVAPAAKPIETVATTRTAPKIRMVQPAAPKGQVAAAAAPARTRVVAAPASPVPAKPARVARVAKGTPANGCYADVPVREVFELRGGGRVTLCTAGDGNLRDARPPRLAGGAGAVAASGFVEPAPKGAVRVQQAAPVKPPKGYKMAWQDDRLNPLRGKGTAEGWAAQDQVWTREVPARLADAGRSGKQVVVVRRVTASTKSPTPEAGKAVPKGKTGGAYVQVGSFSVAGNAEGAVARLRQLGMPVARAKATRSGKAFQVILAGPFATQEQANAALSKTRRAGFSDAFLR